MQFGFLPKSLDVSDGNISIRSTADGRTILAEFESGGRVSDGWYQKPVGKVRQAERYELPLTHEIEVRASQDDDELRFLILILGFLHGLRLLPEGWGHLHPTAVKTGRFNNFGLKDSEIIPCLISASNFYAENRQTRNVKRLLSAITLSHWGQTQSLQFDEFNYLYMAIDACWKICEARYPTAVQRFRCGKRKTITHSKRSKIMCDILGLSLPTIFDPSSAISVSSIRNDLIHEGIVADLSIGHAVIEADCLPEMMELTEKLILGLLGVKAGYLKTGGGDRQRHLLDLEK
jgi:hypothetical protein